MITKHFPTTTEAVDAKADMELQSNQVFHPAAAALMDQATKDFEAINEK